MEFVEGQSPCFLVEVVMTPTLGDIEDSVQPELLLSYSAGVTSVKQ